MSRCSIGEVREAAGLRDPAASYLERSRELSKSIRKELRAFGHVRDAISVK